MATAPAVLGLIRALHPSFRSQQDKVVFAVHGVLLASGFRLVAVGNQPELTKDQALVSKEVALQGWNESQEYYSFQYARKKPSPLVLLLKAVPVEELIALSLLPDGSEPSVLDLNVSRYVVVGQDEEDLEEQYQNLEELVAKVSSLLPRETDDADKAASAAATQPSDTAARQTTSTEFAAEPSSPERSPLLADVPTRGGPAPYPLGGIGREDIDPLAIPGPGGIHPFHGGIPGGLPGGGIRGGGMHVGPDSDIFQGRVRHPRGVGGIPARPGMPPGVRWDPVRPEGMEGWNPEDFQRPGQGRPGFHPDLPYPPPGGNDWDSMFG